MLRKTSIQPARDFRMGRYELTCWALAADGQTSIAATAATTKLLPLMLFPPLRKGRKLAHGSTPAHRAGVEMNQRRIHGAVVDSVNVSVLL